MTDTANMLTVADVARLTGLKSHTILVYRLRGTIPPEDGMFLNSPWWRRETIDAWIAQRATDPRVRVL